MKFLPFSDHLVAQMVSCRPSALRNLWSNPRPFCVVHVMDKMALGEVFSRVVRFSTVIVIPQLLHAYIRLSTIGLIKS